MILLAGSWGVSHFTHAGLAVIPVVFLFYLWRRSQDKTIAVQWLMPLLILLGVISVSTVFWGVGRDRYEIFRDLYYFIKPVLFIYAGILLYGVMKCDYSACLRMIAAVIAVQIVLQFLFALVSGVDFGLDSRQEGGFVGIESNILFLITALARRCRFPLFGPRKLLLLELLALFGIALSFGRTFYIFTALAWGLIWFDSKLLYRGTAILFFSLGMLIIFHGAALAELFHVEVEDYSSLDNKLRNSFNELLVYERTDMSAINQEWRGFEAYLGLRMFSEGNAAQRLLGQGAGAVCYNNVFPDGKLSSLPIFHNGYITILLKTGYLGLMIFFCFVCTFFGGSAEGEREHYRSSLLSLLGIYLLFQTQVIHGIFTNNTPMFLLLLTGVSFACRGDVAAAAAPAKMISQNKMVGC